MILTGYSYAYKTGGSMKIKLKFDDILITAAYIQILLVFFSIEDIETTLIAAIIITSWFVAQKVKSHIRKKDVLYTLIHKAHSIKKVVSVDLYRLDGIYEAFKENE